MPGKIDSFGSCHNNADIDSTLQELGIYDDVGTHTKWNEKITLISRYRFTLAFEVSSGSFSLASLSAPSLNPSLTLWSISRPAELE